MIDALVYAVGGTMSFMSGVDRLDCWWRWMIWTMLFVILTVMKQ